METDAVVDVVPRNVFLGIVSVSASDNMNIFLVGGGKSYHVVFVGKSLTWHLILMVSILVLKNPNNNSTTATFDANLMQTDPTDQADHVISKSIITTTLKFISHTFSVSITLFGSVNSSTSGSVNSSTSSSS